MHHKKITLWEAIGSPANFFVGDANLGKLGTIEPTYERPRQSGGSYPYKSPAESEFEDEESDSEDEDEVDPIDSTRFFNKMLGRMGASDSLAANSVDKQYYTPTGGDPWLREAYGGSRSGSQASISPIPGLYDKMQRGPVGASQSLNYSSGVRTSRKTGTKKGLAAPHKSTVPEYSRWDEKNDEDPAVSKIRQIVIDIMNQNRGQK